MKSRRKKNRKKKRRPSIRPSFRPQNPSTKHAAGSFCWYSRVNVEYTSRFVIARVVVGFGWCCCWAMLGGVIRGVLSSPSCSCAFVWGCVGMCVEGCFSAGASRPDSRDATLPAPPPDAITPAQQRRRMSSKRTLPLLSPLLRQPLRDAIIP